MKIKNFNTDNKILIIAEIGNNHEGKYNVAASMIQAAAKTGVDAVKFQTFRTEHYVSQQNKERFKRLKSFELSYVEFKKLSNIAHEEGLLFISTPFDLVSADILTDIVDAFKISSSDNTFYPLIEFVAGKGKPMIASTGIATLAEIHSIYARIQETWARQNIRQDLALLHCVNSYPVPLEQINLSFITILKNHFSCTIGYSDHSLGTDAAVLSVALGARIIEKHFTLDKNYSDFCDHKISADPREMTELVIKTKCAEIALGNGLAVQQVEEQSRLLLRRSIVAANDLPVDHYLTKKDITWTRTPGGIPPGQEYLILGERLINPLKFGELIELSNLR